MKRLLSMTVVSWALSAGPAVAVQLSVTPYPNNVYAIFLDGESTVFNTVDFTATPNGSALFQNVPSFLLSPRPPGQSLTYRNGYLNGDPIDDPANKGWSLLGIVNTPQKLAFAGGPLGQNISTAPEPNGDLFLANLMLPTNATANVRVHLIDAGISVFDETIVVGVPEPATLALAGLGVLSFAAVSRRRPAARH